LIDFLPARTADGDDGYRWRAGGSPFNVCIGAARLGLPVSFLGTLSTDLFGEELHEALRREGVELGLVERVGRPTTLAFVSQARGAADVRYAFFKENAADRALTADRVMKALSGRSFGAAHVSLGAVTLEDESMAEAFEAFFRAAKAGGAFTSFDPNIRQPMIVGGSEAYRGRVERLTQAVDVAKASDADIEFLYGEGADLDAVAGRWLDLGARLVVVTRGPRGASAYVKVARGPDGDTEVVSIRKAPPCSDAQTVDSEGRPVPVVDTVGAGDTLTGALLAGLLGAGGATAAEGDGSLVAQVSGAAPWAEAEEGGAASASLPRLGAVLARAVAAAAVTCSRPGADPPTAEELEHVLSVVNVAREG